MRRRRHQNAWIAPLVVFSLILLFAAFMVFTWELPKPDYVVDKPLPEQVFDGLDVPPPQE